MSGRLYLCITGKLETDSLVVIRLKLRRQLKIVNQPMQIVGIQSQISRRLCVVSLRMRDSSEDYLPLFASRTAAWNLPYVPCDLL